MTPLRERITGALRLQPMSITQVARCLSVEPETARQALRRLERKGAVRVHGWIRRGRYNALAFEVAP